MSFSVNTNAGALAALGNLNRTTASLETTQSRVNTGLKVASAKDNGATFAIAQTLRSDVAGYRAVNNSLDRASSELDVAIAGAEAVSDLLIQMKEKAVAASDLGLDAESRISLNDDFQQLRDQIATITDSAVFNGKNLLTGDPVSAITDPEGGDTIDGYTSSLTLFGLRLQDADIDTPEGRTVTVTPITLNSLDDLVIESVDTLDGVNNPEALNAMLNLIDDEANSSTLETALSNNGTNLATLNDSLDRGTGLVTDANVLSALEQFMEAVIPGSNFGRDYGSPDLPDNLEVRGGSLFLAGNGTNAAITTSSAPVIQIQGGAKDAIEKIGNGLEVVNNVLSNLGSTANRVDLQQRFVRSLSDSIDVGIGNLVDADMARESANLQAFQTKQQLGLQALSIANQAPQSVLSLFG
jgi:flagellin